MAFAGKILVVAWLTLMIWSIATTPARGEVFADGFECGEPFSELRRVDPLVSRNNGLPYTCTDWASCFDRGSSFILSFSNTYVSLLFVPEQPIERLLWEDTTSPAGGWTVSYSWCEGGLLDPIRNCTRTSGPSGASIIASTDVPEPGICFLPAGEPVWLNVAPWAAGPTCEGSCRWLVAPR